MKKEILVLGAGISGLALSWFLKKRYGSNVNIKVLEKSSRVGGWIQTLNIGNFLFEQGPRSCRPHGQGLETLKLIEELQLDQEVIFADPSSKKRYLYQGHQLVPLPNGIISLLSSPFAMTILKALWQDWRTPKGTGNDESIADFISRRLGPKIAQELIDPMMSGIYAGDIRELSIHSCLPDLFAWEQNHGGIVKGMLFRKRQPKALQTPFIQSISKHPIFSFRKGMETLPRELAKRLEAEILLGSEASSIAMQGSKAMVTLLDGTTYLADHVFSTLPAPALSQLTKEVNILPSVPTASVAVVNLGYKSKVLNAKGFGYLIPSKEKEEILGVVWDSSIFPQQQEAEATCLTVMLGGMHHPHIDKLSETGLLNISLNAISKHLNIKAKPDAFHIKVASQAIPQFLVGHEEKMGQLHTQLAHRLPCLTIHGSYLGVSVNACIANAKKIVEEGFN